MAKLSIEQALLKAKWYAKKGNTGEAQKLYQAVVKAFPKNKRGQRGLASLGKIKKNNDQKPPQETINQLITLFNQGKFSETVDQAQACTKKYPNAFNVWNILGVGNNVLGKVDEAIKAYERALSINPNFADAHHNIGNALFEQGKLDQAIEAYKKSLDLEPNNAEAYFNMGNTLQEQGRLDESISSYIRAIRINPNHAGVHNNMGNAFFDQQKLDEAIKAYSKSVNLKSDNSKAYYSLGNAHKAKGNIQEAISNYDKAVKLEPNFAEAWNNMGNAFKAKDNLSEAIIAYKQAFTIDPSYAEAYSNLGNTFKAQGRLDNAISAYEKALSLKPDNPEIIYNMGSILKGVLFQKPNPGLQIILTSILEHKTFSSPKDIAPAAISLLRQDKSLQRYLEKNVSYHWDSLQDMISKLSQLPLLLKLMSVCPIADLQLENLLKGIRYHLLRHVHQLDGSHFILTFQSSLALQCHTNEYIYDLSDDENELFLALEGLVDWKISRGEIPSPQYILCLASYQSLDKYQWSDLLVLTKEIAEVFKRQVHERDIERNLKSNIARLEEEVNNKVSVKVRSQYEESPYPRWVNVGFALHPATISQVVSTLKLKLSDLKVCEIQTPNILVAGCGTGQHSIATAKRFKNAKILAVDLSLSSIAYALRKTEELNVQNIQYMQADILNLKSLKRKFDIIESVGVLHHMQEPMDGWRMLVDCLQDNGLMKIGLYSQLARQDIVRMRIEIAQSHIGSSDKEMKLFRDSIINSEVSHYKTILSASDFYSLSNFRDLLFHVKEHRFTLPQLVDCLDKLGLKFCGFEAERFVDDFKIKNNAPNDPYDLRKWQIYEEANPQTFNGMYQFWCQKIN